MAADQPSLESAFNKATNPINVNEDWNSIMAFCDQVNQELEGPQIAVRLISHKAQSPQKAEALYSLSVLESCVKNCGKRFHQEIGKFRFLNELIKVVSPKYLGTHTAEDVKKKVIELMYSWSQSLTHEPKIDEAYQMLKRQGIVKTDPVHVDKTFEKPDDKQKMATFESEEKSKLLARLLKSKHPEDLQAANRLIKNMVKQDAEKSDKLSKRMMELDTVNNNVKLLAEMLLHYEPHSASEADMDIMKELFENIEKQRPGLFRLASDTDEKDTEGIKEILAVNDSVVKIMSQYKKIVEGVEENGLLDLETKTDKSALLELNPDLKDDSLMKQENNVSNSLLDDELADLGQGATAQPTGDNIGTLDDLFKSPTAAASNPDDLLSLGMASTTAGLGLSTSTAPASMGLSSMLPPPPQTTMPVFQTIPSNAMTAGLSNTDHQKSTGVFSEADSLFGSSPNSSAPSLQPITASSSSAASTQDANKNAPGLNDIDLLGESLLKQSLPPEASLQRSFQQPQKITMNQLQEKQKQVGSTGADPAGLQPTLKSLAGAEGSSSTPGSATASPHKAALSSEVKPLTDVFVSLESIKPGSVQPLTAYDKDGMKIVIHFGKDTPRPDIIVMVVSVMSTNTSAVKNCQFQAAVPKSMRVKLQPPSATDLPAYNPILPPTAITQVMLMANPQKEKIRLKYKLSYKLDDKLTSDFGEVDNFPVQ